MGHQSYVLLCTEIASYQPSEEEFSEKIGIFLKVTIFHIGNNKQKSSNLFLGYHDALKIYDAPKLCTLM